MPSLKYQLEGSRFIVAIPFSALKTFAAGRLKDITEPVSYKQVQDIGNFEVAGTLTTELVKALADQHVPLFFGIVPENSLLYMPGAFMVLEESSCFNFLLRLSILFEHPENASQVAFNFESLVASLATAVAQDSPEMRVLKDNMSYHEGFFDIFGASSSY